jgi:hypothetical protein
LKPPKGKGQPVLYLDFDGTVHHERCFWHPKRGAYLHAPDRYALFQHVPLLEALLTPYPDVRIVLSTSWVMRYGCDGAANRLTPALRDRVIGATFHSKMSHGGFLLLPRGMQVWCDVLRRQPGSWLALDDDPIGWPEDVRSHLVLTDPYEGISPAEVQTQISQRLELLAELQLP